MEIILERFSGSPERINEFRNLLRTLLFRALNDTQLLILRKVKREGMLNPNPEKTLNALLQEIEKRYRKSLSSLKMNAKMLRDLGLIDYGDKKERRPVKLTHMGDAVLQLLGMDI